MTAAADVPATPTATFKCFFAYAACRTDKVAWLVHYVRMRNSTFPDDGAPVPAEIKQAACQLVPTSPAPHGEVARDGTLPLRTIGRPDTLTAQRVEVGIVLHAMLGESAAAEYLNKHAVNAGVIERVLNCQGRRRGTHDASGVRT